MTINPINSELDRRVDKVLEFYRIQGVEADRRPRFGYFDKSVVTPNGLELTGLCGQEADFYRNSTVNYLTHCTKILMEILGIKTSYEGAQELLASLDLVPAPGDLEEIIREEHPDFHELTAMAKDQGLDIVILKPYADVAQRMTEGAREEFLAHELWHFLEKEKSVSASYPIIVEATATYAEAKYDGLSRDEIQAAELEVEQTPNGLERSRRVSGAKTVNRVLWNEAYPFVSLLDPSVRYKINEAVLDDQTNFFRHVVNEGTDSYRSVFVATLGSSLASKGRKKLTQRSLLTELEEIGAKKLVGELENQDLTRLVRILNEYLRLSPEP